MKRKPAVAAPGRQVMQRAYDFLRSEGLDPHLLPDGDPRFSRLAFKCDGSILVVTVDERYPDFLEVSLSKSFDPPLPDELTALRLANAVQDTHKIVKIGVDRGLRRIRIQAPVLLRGQPPTRDLLERCVTLLWHTAGEFEDLLRGTTQARA